MESDFMSDTSSNPGSTAFKTRAPSVAAAPPDVVAKRKATWRSPPTEQLRVALGRDALLAEIREHPSTETYAWLRISRPGTVSE